MGGGGEEGCNVLNVECYKISGKQTMSQTKYGQKMFEKSNDNGTRIEIQIILKGRIPQNCQCCGSGSFIMPIRIRDPKNVHMDSDPDPRRLKKKNYTKKFSTTGTSFKITLKNH